MCVPHALVGIIIGRGGANIRQLESSLRVKLRIESKKNREGAPNLCIDGSPIDVRRARDAILANYQCNRQSQCAREECKFIHASQSGSTRVELGGETAESGTLQLSASDSDDHLVDDSPLETEDNWFSDDSLDEGGTEQSTEWRQSKRWQRARKNTHCGQGQSQMIWKIRDKQ